MDQLNQPAIEEITENYVCVNVYLQGSFHPEEDENERKAWYRLRVKDYFPTTSFTTGSVAVAEIIAELSVQEYGTGYRFGIIEDDIYVIGGCSPDPNLPFVNIAYPSLLKHNKNDYSPLWELESTSGTFPRAYPLVASVGKELYVLAGSQCFYEGFEAAEVPRRDGQIYLVDMKEWRDIPDPKEDFRGFAYGALVERDDGGPRTEMALFSLQRGSIGFYDLITGNIRCSNDHVSMAVLFEFLIFHRDDDEDDEVEEAWDLDRVVGLDEIIDFNPLLSSACTGQPVFRHNTFYWFGYDLRLYAYCLSERRWFYSDPVVEGPPDDVRPIGTVLLALPNNRFVAILSVSAHSLAAITFFAVRVRDTLDVIVQSVQNLPILHPNFRPSHAILDYTGPSRTMRQYAMETSLKKMLSERMEKARQKAEEERAADYELWEKRMVHLDGIFATALRSAAKARPGGPITTPVHDQGTEEYENPTADILFPATPLLTALAGTVQTPLPGTVQTPLPGTAQAPLPGTADSSSMYNIPTGGSPFTPNDYSPLNDTGVAAEMKAGPGRTSPSMQPPSHWLNQRPPLDVNVANVEGQEGGDPGASQQPMT